MENTFSSYVINALTDVIIGGSGNNLTPPIGVYRTAYDLQEFMKGCNISFQVGGSRVPSVRDKLHELLFIDPTGEDIIRVIEHVADHRAYISEPDKTEAVIAHLNKALEADGFQVIMIRGKAKLQKTVRDSAVLDTFRLKVDILNFDTVTRDLDRALANAESDPEDAVTAACSTLETVCRSILIEMGTKLPQKKDISGLMRALQEPLGLSPSRTDFPTDIADDVRQVLGGLTTVAKGIGALRTHGGDAHGRERGRRSVDARIARLAIHSSSTIALFLIETWERQSEMKTKN